MRYAKAAVDDIHIRIGVTNRGPETATLHVLPTLWFRNTWAWNDGGQKPMLAEIAPPHGTAWGVCADHPTLGRYFLYGRHPAQTLFTENESNRERLWSQMNPVPYVNACSCSITSIATARGSYRTTRASKVYARQDWTGSLPTFAATRVSRLYVTTMQRPGARAGRHLGRARRG